MMRSKILPFPAFATELTEFGQKYEDLPRFGLKAGDRAMVIEHYPMQAGREDGYSLEGFDTEIKGVTVEVRASQIIAVKAPIAIPS